MKSNSLSLTRALRETARILRLARPYWGQLLQGVFLSGLLGVIGLVTPYLTKLLIDRVYPTGDVSLMHVLVGATLALGLATTILSGVHGFFMVHVGSRLRYALRLLFFNHVQHLPPRFFEATQVGEISSRFRDLNGALALATRVVQTTLLNGSYLLLVPPFLFILEWRLALVAIATTPIALLIATLPSRLLRERWQHAAEAAADLEAYQLEMLARTKSVKSLAAERWVFQESQRRGDDALDKHLAARGLGQFLSSGGAIAMTVNSTFLMWLGWTLILQADMSLGDYIAFMAYLGYLYGPITNFLTFLTDFQRSAVHLARMFEYLDRDPEIDPRCAFKPLLPVTRVFRGKIEIRDVDFQYTEGPTVFRNLSVTFQQGTVSAIIGPTGCGKSTLLKLIALVEKPLTGEIVIDGHPLGTLPLMDVRRQVSVVWQQDSLFRGTVWDNITFGVDEPSTKMVWKAIETAQLTELIMSLPEGLETLLAENSATLSGGEMQRLAIARAIIQNRPILLLDEATTGLDVETERKLMLDLVAHHKDRTIIFATHRVQTAASMADSIVLLEDGAAVCGVHESLSTSSETYRRLLGLNTVMGTSESLKVVG